MGKWGSGAVDRALARVTAFCHGEVRSTKPEAEGRTWIRSRARKLDAPVELRVRLRAFQAK
jgi:hypothetical protein